MLRREWIFKRNDVLATSNGNEIEVGICYYRYAQNTNLTFIQMYVSIERLW